MKIYMVTSGEYSDYRVCGLYSTTEKAEYAKGFYKADTINELELDELPEHPHGMTKWHVDMFKDGTAGEVFNQGGGMTQYDHEWRPPYDGHARFVMFAADRDHAIKIANERRLAMIADGRWDMDHRDWLIHNGYVKP